MHRRGFTIIELLVVITIIGILAGVISVSASSARRKSRDDKRKADMQTIALSLEMYYAANKSYPSSLNALSTYTSSLPTDSSYTYKVVSGNQNYLIDAALESNANADDINNVLPGCADAAAVTDPNCFKTATFKDTDGTVHYRIAGK